MSSYDRCSVVMPSPTGFSLSMISVLRETITGPEGVVDMTMNDRGLLTVSTRMFWPRSIGLPSSILRMYRVPPTSLTCFVGASVIRFASFASTFLIFTLSSRPTLALLRMLPSIRMMLFPVSSGYPGQTMPYAFSLLLISMMSPLATPTFSIRSLSSLAMPLPASRWYASATRTTISPLIVHHLFRFQIQVFSSIVDCPLSYIQ